MNNILPIMLSEKENASGFETGIVKMIRQDNYLVESDSGKIISKKAVACLIEPEAGDRVLFYTDQQRHCYILSVLERTTEKPATMIFTQGVNIQTSTGGVNIVSDEVNVAVAGGMNFSGITMTLNALKGKIMIDNAEIVGTTMRAQLQKVQFVASRIQTISTTVIQKAQKVIRYVQELDRSRVGRLDYRSENTLSLKGKRTRIEAEKNVSLQGDKVLIG